MMLGVALCWGFTSALDKIRIQNFSPLFFDAYLISEIAQQTILRQLVTAQYPSLVVHQTYGNIRG